MYTQQRCMANSALLRLFGRLFCDYMRIVGEGHMQARSNGIGYDRLQ